MTKRLFAAVVTSAVGVLLAPGAASAVPPEDDGIHAGHIAALTQVDGAGQVVAVRIQPLATAAVTIGLAYTGNVVSKAPPLKVIVGRGLDLPKTFDNCWYFTDGGTDGAWCDVSRTLEIATAYKLARFQVQAAPDAKAGEIDDIAFDWDETLGPNATAKAQAQKDAGAGSTPVRGGNQVLTLEKAPDLTKANNPHAGVARVRLVPPDPKGAPDIDIPTGPDGSGSDEPSTTTAPDDSTSDDGYGDDDSAALPGVPAPPAAGSDGAGGGLPITGSNTVLLAGAGLAPILIGALLLLARRRTRFTA